MMAIFSSANARRGLAATVLLGGLVGGCDWFGESKPPPIPGTRLSILALDRSIKPDPSLSGVAVALPRPVENAEWPQAGGYPNHVMHHLALGDAPKVAWRISLGDAGGDDRRILSTPVVAAGMVFAMDSGRRVVAVSAAGGGQAWSFDLRPEGESDGGFGGGVAYANGRLYVATGWAQVVALDAQSGKEIWRTGVAGPVRTAPTVSGGRVFAITIDNQLEALSADDGRKLWNHAAISETAGLMGGSSPAVEADAVIAAFTSGELFGMRVENGRVAWQDNLAAVRRIDAISDLADIRGRPVIDRGTVFAISHSGRMVAIDLRTGNRIWEQEIGSLESPWVVGDFIYVLTPEAEVVCLSRGDGRIRWVRPLPRHRREVERKDPLFWTGPVVAGDRVIVVGSNKEAFAISPYTGELMGTIQLPDAVYAAPVVAGGTLYVVTDEASLIALR
ncbi:outer membrane protein assembly factor BamB [Stella humosa]|uniref:Outer membrane protein assembly factor BamB n=1 Tax=Stella humosa TaxID=94 RepID=A0A3N1M1B6_9PROT|nr:PQQ-like beta-propeller repeat protein [Stella humosa]ROQ01304.1 outer membrane protein assembly factor BamB [Stella humosa]BBK31678.1 outer membrane protein assembly factor BamB [Stella humosa]